MAAVEIGNCQILDLMIFEFLKKHPDDVLHGWK